MSLSEIPKKPSPTRKKVKRSKFLGHAELGSVGPCSLCGREPSYDPETDEFDPDFLYLATPAGPFQLYHAICSETWGGCGHLTLGTTPQACIEVWNNPTPDVEVRFDLPKMEQMIAEFDVAERRWWDTFSRTGNHHHGPQPEGWWVNDELKEQK